MNNILIVGLGSLFGGIARYLLSGFIQRHVPIAFPVGILLVNLLGCFIIGIVAGLLTHVLATRHHLLLAVGFCGSFTTFSTFSLDNLQLLHDKAFFLLGLNIVLSVGLGLLATWVGYLCAQSLTR